MQNPRGTYDIFGKDIKLRNYVVEELFKLSGNYGFDQIQTPIFEHTELFVRSVGEETDIVSKEMYTFLDKKERSITLRPELTAPVVRAFNQNKLYATNPNARFAYFGPAFRYERPQTGRFRQFHQFGVESFGNNLAIHDAEIMTLSYAILKTFNLHDNVTLKINSLGQAIERKAYIDKLVGHLANFEQDLCADCQTRIKQNPLRVLDCKVDAESEALKTAPKLIDNLTQESKARFDQVCHLLDIQNINYEIDDNLVRGLDYYNDTVFEFSYKFSDGKELAILGGGRYDNLVEQLGGKTTPAFGFGIGVERLIDAVKDAQPDILDSMNDPVYVYLAPLCEEAMDLSFKTVNKLRYYNVPTSMNYEVTSLKSTFKKTDRLGVQILILIGEDELKNHQVTIKNLHTKEEFTAPLDEVVDELIEEFYEQA